MRFKDIKQYNKQYNMSKIKNILHKADCTFIALLNKDMKKLDVNGICKYVMFNDVLYSSTYVIEYKKLGVDNVIRVVNKKDIED